MPNGNSPRTCFEADSDETGRLSAGTLLSRDFRRRAPAFIGITSGARDTNAHRVIAKKEAGQLPHCGSRFRSFASGKTPYLKSREVVWDATEKEERLERGTGTKEKTLFKNGGGGEKIRASHTHF
jgi:hypothetical protein